MFKTHFEINGSRISYILLLKSFMFVTNSCNRNLFKKATYVHRRTIKINKIKGFFFIILTNTKNTF